MWKIALKISAIILLLTTIVVLFFYLLKKEISMLFWFIPIYFVIMSIFLSVFAKKNINNKRILLNVLLFRFITVFGGIIVLFLGLFFDKPNILGFTILFVIYYIVFSTFETLEMIKISRENSKL